jgi:hypothetical protein
VFFTVTNVSKVAATPVCTIRASGRRGRYKGTDVLDEMDRIRAGQTIPMTAQVTISHPGSAVRDARHYQVRAGWRVTETAPGETWPRGRPDATAWPGYTMPLPTLP